MTIDQNLKLANMVDPTFHIGMFQIIHRDHLNIFLLTRSSNCNILEDLKILYTNLVH